MLKYTYLYVNVQGYFLRIYFCLYARYNIHVCVNLIIFLHKIYNFINKILLLRIPTVIIYDLSLLIFEVAIYLSLFHSLLV